MSPFFVFLVTMGKTHTYIQQMIDAKNPGDLVISNEFRGTGSTAAIKKALSRLNSKGKIKRLSQGIYYLPKIDPVIGEIRPGTDEIVKMLAAKEKIRIKPAGANALHKLGLSTQVPTRFVYLTDGHARAFRLGKLQIKFKATTPKKLSAIGPVSSLLIQALDELGTDKIDGATEQKISELLDRETPGNLRHDLSIASTKVNDYIIKLLKKKGNESLVTTRRGTTKGKH